MRLLLTGGSVFCGGGFQPLEIAVSPRGVFFVFPPPPPGGAAGVGLYNLFFVARFFGVFVFLLGAWVFF